MCVCGEGGGAGLILHLPAERPPTLNAWGRALVKTLGPLRVATFSDAGDAECSTLKSLFVDITPLPPPHHLPQKSSLRVST